ncbi:hypothetical protein [Verrucomicrobium spinosum]|uniref:hypothetical protein n=1 Tax=Verrucomicrobium spinosum TaxID=2736 RepID=UPI0009466EDF|nr:hypothetical protein [Verrucomicrobium spinosum]
MKYFFLSYFLVVVTVVSFAGFRGHKFEKPPIQVFPDMDDQAKVKAQVKSEFFADGVGMRHPVTGTLPMGFEQPSKPASEATRLRLWNLPTAVRITTPARWGTTMGMVSPRS